MWAEVAAGELTCRVRVLGRDKTVELIERVPDALCALSEVAAKVAEDQHALEVRLVEATAARRESRAAVEDLEAWSMASCV